MNALLIAAAVWGVVSVLAALVLGWLCSRAEVVDPDPWLEIFARRGRR